jgi:hypothetical protein
MSNGQASKNIHLLQEGKRVSVGSIMSPVSSLASASREEIAAASLGWIGSRHDEWCEGGRANGMELQWKEMWY